MSEWIIYKHTAPNGKCYIGQTKQNPEDRWQNGRGYEHNVHFSNAIQKYGWNNFQHHIIQAGIQTQEEANLREIYWIEYYDSFVNGYNLTKGGENHEHLGVPVFQISCETLEIVNSFQTIRHAEVATNIDHTQIGRCCSSNKKGIRAGGFYWCFQDEWSEDWTPKRRKVPNMPKRAVYQIGKDHQIIAKFESGLLAEYETGIPCGRINRVCHHKGYITAGGYYWCFVEEWDDDWRPMIPKDERPVVRINKENYSDIKIYPMISIAARDNNIKSSELISRACGGRIISVGGFYWCYLDDYNCEWTPRHDNNKKKIICVETGEIYDSISDAIRITNGSTNIARACRDSGLTSGGFHWAYLDKWDKKQWNVRQRKEGNKRLVRCIETGEVYESATLAAKTNKLDNSSISKCCKDASKTAGGFHWCFEDEYDASWKPKAKKVGRHGMKKVYCYELNKEFDCISTANKETGIDVSSIIRCCKGKQEVAGNYHWKYVE